MFCTSCGKEIKDEAAFCAHCGVPVSGKSGEQKESEKQKDVTKESPPSDPMHSQGSEPKKKESWLTQANKVLEMNNKRTPLNQINNGYAVCLIFVPIIGVLLFEPILMSIFGVDTFFPVLIFYMAANATTVYYDEKQLNKAKVKINNGLIWGAILVPVYCYLRGSAINKIYNLGGLKSQWVFLCWIGSLFISGIIDVIMYS